MNTGEDTQGLRKILDLSRMISVFLLAMHFYIRFFQVFKDLCWQSEITDRIVGQLAKLAIFDGWWLAKFAALLFLAISLLGVKGKKDEEISLKKIYLYMLGSVTQTVSFKLTPLRSLCFPEVFCHQI